VRNKFSSESVFGSRAELAVYQALVDFQRGFPVKDAIAVLPLPGARLRDAGVRTPDFVVVGNGSEANETVQFGIDSVTYEIDLSTAHATELRQALQPYVAVARKAGGGTRRAARGSRSAGPSPSEVRAWAKAEGLKVSDRGRVPEELIVRFRAAGQ
jgi:hypothetical protein